MAALPGSRDPRGTGVVTLSPTDRRAWRAEVAGRDAAYAAGWRAGVIDGRRHQGRLVALGIAAAVLVLGRRLHPVAGLAVALAVLVGTWPLIFVLMVVELTVRHHRRHGHWPRTAAYAVSWLIGAWLVLAAVAHRSAWPLAGAAALVVAWTAGPRALALYRRHRGRSPEAPGPGSGGGVGPSWPAPSTPGPPAGPTGFSLPSSPPAAGHGRTGTEPPRPPRCHLG